MKIWFMTPFLLWSFLACSQIEVDFDVDVTEACESAVIKFTDLSTSSGILDSWKWSLGITNSTEQNPSVFYNQTGTFDICLEVKDNLGNKSELCKDALITIYPNPIIDFEASVQSGCPPLQVSFDHLNNSNSTLTQMIWNVGGDLGTIISNNPSEAISTNYSLAGEYSIILSVQDENGCQTTKSKVDFIEVFSSPEPDIEIKEQVSCDLPKQYELIINDPENNTAYTWFLEDELVGEGTYVVQEINEFGIYDLTLISETPYCRDTLVLEEAISTYGFGIEMYSDLAESCLGESVAFSLSNAENLDSVLWEFGDGNFSNEFNPSHVFGAPGCFDVKATLFKEFCQENIQIAQCIQVHDLPDELEIFVGLNQNCTLPAALHFNAFDNQPGLYTWQLNGPQLDTVLYGTQNNFVLNRQGQYELSFFYTDQNGCTFAHETEEIELSPFTPRLNNIGQEGCIPLTIDFDDLVADADEAVSFLWNIDGVFQSMLEQPSYVLNDTGKFDLQLILENEIGCVDTLIKEDFIRGGLLPIIAFDAQPKEDCASELVEFFNNSSSFVDTWLWEFGDSDTSSLDNPTHIFKDTNAFDITLTAWHNGCQNSLTQFDFIDPIAPVSIFEIQYDCKNPYEVKVINKSLGEDSLRWVIHYTNKIDTIINQDTLNLSFLGRGDYPIHLSTFNFETGCSFVQSGNIQIRDPQAFLSIDDNKGCVPMSLNINDHLVDFNEVYYFFDDYLEGDSLHNPSVILEEAGVYSPPSIVIRDIHGCESQYTYPDSIYVNEVKAIPDFRQIVCLPDTIGLRDKSTSSFGEINSWQWKVGDFESAQRNDYLEMFNDEDLDVFLSAGDTWGCKDSVLIKDPFETEFPTVDFESITLTCTNDTIVFSNLSYTDAILEYAWDFGDGTFSSEIHPVHSYNEEGLYTVCLRVESIRGCSKTVCKENYIQIADPIALFSADTTSINCPPILVSFTNESENANNYLWNFGDASGLSQLEAPAHIYNSPGFYDLTLIAQQSERCADTLLIEDYVQVNGPSGSFSVIADQTCVPLKVKLNSTAQDLEFVSWDFDNGVVINQNFNPNGNEIEYTYQAVGAYKPRLILNDSTGCKVTYEGQEVKVNDIFLSFDVEDSLMCLPPEGLDLVLYNSSLSTSPEVEYTWSVPGSIEGSIIGKNPQFHLDSIGTYDVLLVGEVGYCRDSLYKNSFIETIDKTSISAEGDTVCFGEEAIIDVTGNASTYTWLSSNLDVHQQEKQNIKLVPPNSFDALVIGNRQYCQPDSALVKVKVYEEIRYSLEKEYSAYANINVEVQMDWDEQRNYEFDWFPHDFLSCIDCPNPWIENITKPLQYELTIVDKDSGCEIEDQISVRYQNDCTWEAFYLPNIFTPNGDGSNDGYRVFAQNEQEFLEIGIYDRWGEELFRSENIEEEWDAVFRNKPLQSGVYAVSVRALCLESKKEYIINQTVTLARY